MTLTNQQLKANETYFNNLINTTKMFIWKDEGLVFMIEDKKFICDTGKKTKALASNTSRDWFKKNAIVK